MLSTTNAGVKWPLLLLQISTARGKLGPTTVGADNPTVNRKTLIWAEGANVTITGWQVRHCQWVGSQLIYCCPLTTAAFIATKNIDFDNEPTQRLFGFPFWRPGVDLATSRAFYQPWADYQSTFIKWDARFSGFIVFLLCRRLSRELEWWRSILYFVLW